MILLINTIEKNKILVYVKNGTKISSEAFLGDYKASEKLLFVIDKLFKKNKLKLSGLKGIIVINGLGSFTALRIAISVANTLGYVYKVPVIDYLPLKDENINVDKVFTVKSKELKRYKKTHLIMPVYERGANITVKRK